MGLFDFAKDIGKKLFSSDEDAAKKIAEYFRENNPGIEDMSVVFKDGEVTLIGKTDSPEAAQKAVLLAGNIEGVEKVVAKIEINDPESDQPIEISAALEPGNVEYYEIKSGDTLSKIAKAYYGDAMAYVRIFEANREVIQDPDLIYPGQKIRIPKD